MGLPYTNPPCIFLHQLLENQLTNIEKDSFLLIANGLYDILLFFHEHPISDFGFKFVVTKEIIKSIPQEWISHFYFYQYEIMEKKEITTDCLIVDFYEDTTHLEILKETVGIYLHQSSSCQKLVLLNFKSRENENHSLKATSNSSEFFNYLTKNLRNHDFIPPDFFQTHHNLNSINFFFAKERIEIGVSLLESDILNLCGRIGDLFSDVSGDKVASFIASPSCNLEILKLTARPRENSSNLKQLMKNIDKHGLDLKLDTAYNSKQLIQKIIMNTSEAY